MHGKKKECAFSRGAASPVVFDLLCCIIYVVFLPRSLSLKVRSPSFFCWVYLVLSLVPVFVGRVAGEKEEQAREESQEGARDAVMFFCLFFLSHGWL